MRNYKEDILFRKAIKYFYMMFVERQVHMQKLGPHEKEAPKVTLVSFRSVQTLEGFQLCFP